MKLGPRYKIAKRLGAQIFEKTQTQRFVLSRERSAKNKKGRRGGSDYQRQLIEKQKLRLSYSLTEKQFSTYVARALESKVPQATLFNELETRLDSIIYRMGLFAIFQAPANAPTVNFQGPTSAPYAEGPTSQPPAY
jgi:small subunit ribosomal protein S4